MKTICAVLAALSIALTARSEAVRTNPKLFRVSADGALVLEGTWRRVTKTGSMEVPKANSFRIECSRSARVCREYSAKLFRPDDHATVSADGSMLLIQVQEFIVQGWDEDAIVAKASPRAGDISLRISLRSQRAERLSQETEERGASGARTQADKWVWE